MILQALVNLYETLVQQERISRPGWSKVKVSWALEISENGELIDILPLHHPDEKGKKMLPREMELPTPVKKTSGVSSNFLWENISYLFGIPVPKRGQEKIGKKETGRAAECFAAAKEKHLAILSDVPDSAAQAVCRFFSLWNVAEADNHPVFMQHKEELSAGENITFLVDGAFVSAVPAVQQAWQRSYDGAVEGEMMRCLITGQETVPELTHPAIKNVRGAQSSGAALVSFNAPAFCSFNREQNANAPISKYAAFAYTTALNYLLADKAHVKYFGDTAVAYWAADAECAYQDAISSLLDFSDDTVTDGLLNNMMTAIAAGKPFDFEDVPLQPENDFYILGLSPNAARLSVRFFYRSTFGELVSHIRQHYEDIDIVSDGSRFRMIPLWALLRETVNEKSRDKAPLPQLSGDVMRSILTGGRYPQTLYNQVMLRIRAERVISRGRAAIIKGCLIRNTKNMTDYQNIKEVCTVSLQEESNYTPYVLGRLFSVLESIQERANPGINATIRDRYFNSACATPAAIFPLLLRLSNSHLKKMEAGTSIYYSKQLGTLTDRLDARFPNNLNLQEQGSFILGYYHQTQKKYEKKIKEEN